MTGCHTEIHKRHVSLHISPGVSSWSMGGKSRTSILGVKMFRGAYACLCLVRKSRSLVYKHGWAETARRGRERRMEWSENEIEKGEREVWKTESCFISDSEAEECFYRGRVDRHFPSQNFGTIGQSSQRTGLSRGTDKAAMGFPR